MFYLVVVDDDAGNYSIEGPMSDDTRWNDAVHEAQKAGRNIRIFGAPETREEAEREARTSLRGEQVARGSILKPKGIF